MPKHTPLIQRHLISVDIKYTFPKEKFILLHTLCGCPTKTDMERLLFNELVSMYPDINSVSILELYHVIFVSIHRRVGNSYMLTSLDIQIWFTQLLQP